MEKINKHHNFDLFFLLFKNFDLLHFVANLFQTDCKIPELFRNFSERYIWTEIHLDDFNLN